MLAPAAILASETPPLAMLNVTPPAVPPPVKPAPAATPVMVPPPTLVAALLITLPSENTSALPPPLIFTFPATSSFCVGTPVPIPKVPPLDITNDLPATAAPFSYRKNPNVSSTNADCCNSQKLFGKFVSSNRIVGAAPRMCSDLAGLAVPRPTFVPVSKIEELMTFAPVASNLATKFCVPPPPIVAAPMAPVLGNTVPTPAAPPEGLASTNDDSGLPPKVSASDAFKAYGTLTSNTRGCSACRSTCSSSQRASPDANSSAGTPFALLAPSKTV